MKLALCTSVDSFTLIYITSIILQFKCLSSICHQLPIVQVTVSLSWRQNVDSNIH